MDGYRRLDARQAYDRFLEQRLFPAIQKVSGMDPTAVRGGRSRSSRSTTTSSPDCARVVPAGPGRRFSAPDSARRLPRVGLFGRTKSAMAFKPRPRS